MKDDLLKVIANFHISVFYKCGSSSTFSTTEKLYSDKDGKVTEEIVKKWENEINESIIKKSHEIYKCSVICTSFFKLDK